MLVEFATGNGGIMLGEGQREEVASLIEEFGRLDAKERRQLEHVNRIAKKAGRPPSKKPSALALAKRKSRAKLKAEKPE
jgi:hypothetical protein